MPIVAPIERSKSPPIRGNVSPSARISSIACELTMTRTVPIVGKVDGSTIEKITIRTPNAMTTA